MILILRYRDLIGDSGSTISSHTRFIDEHKATWWGWWAKPAEVADTGIFSRIRACAHGDSGLTVYLFNSADLSFVRAHCTDVKYGERQSRIRAPDEGALTPQYYNQNSYLAWFKFDKLESVLPDEVVGRLRYGDSLALYTNGADAYARFCGHIIQSADELRQQERSIWVAEFFEKSISRPPRERWTEPQEEIHERSLTSAVPSTLGVGQDQFTRMLKQIEDVRVELSGLRKGASVGLPQEYIDQLITSLQGAHATGKRLYADVIMPDRKKLEVRLAPMHLLEQHNQYASDVSVVQLLLGVFLGALIGLFVSLSYSCGVNWTVPLVATVITLSAVVLMLSSFLYVLLRRKNSQWRQITSFDDRQEHLAIPRTDTNTARLKLT